MNRAEQLWLEFAGMTISSGANDNRRLEMKLAFISGVFAAAVRLRPDNPTEEETAFLRDAQTVLRQSIARYKALERAGSN